MPEVAAQTLIPSPEVRHLQPLDGIRGLAILMVLLTHCFESNFSGRGFALYALGTFFDSGRFGVDLFFVLSGFLITGILIDTRHDPHFFRSFFGRRALRILPLYYGVLLVLLAVTLPLHWSWHGMAPLLFLYLQNLRPAAIDQLAVGRVALFHFWSLAIEEQFYLVWPFLVFALRGRRSGTAWAALFGIVAVTLLRFALALHGTPYLTLHMSLPTRADSLLIGALLAVAYRSSTAWPRVLHSSPAIFLVLAATLAITIVHFGIGTGPLYWLAGFRYTLLAVCFAALLAWSLKPRSVAQQIFVQPWLRFLGKYSYGLYVLHVIVLSFVRLPLRSFLQQRTGSHLVAVAGTGLIAMLLSVLAAVLSFQLFESRFLRLKRFFPYTVIEPARLDTQTPAVASAPKTPYFSATPGGG